MHPNGIHGEFLLQAKRTGGLAVDLNFIPTNLRESAQSSAIWDGQRSESIRVFFKEGF